MFDSHVHYDAAPFQEALASVVAAARAAGVTGALNPAVDVASSRRALEIHRQFPWILPALGIHPLRVDTCADVGACVSELEALAAQGGFVAVGEVGLDFSLGRADEDAQRDHLCALARLAGGLGVPILLHARKGFYESLSVLREAGFGGTGAAHAFSGSRDMARLALDRGFYLSACAVLTRPEAHRLRDVFRWAPRERLLVETDAPDLPPWSRRGQLHRPEDLPLTVSALAECLGLTVPETAALTARNARAMLGEATAEGQEA